MVDLLKMHPAQGTLHVWFLLSSWRDCANLGPDAPRKGKGTSGTVKVTGHRQPNNVSVPTDLDVQKSD